MAGIGFELLQLWRKDTYQSVLRLYGLATVISSGPGLLIIASLAVVCFYSLFATPNQVIAHQFLAIAIYLLSLSMILSSLWQYTFFRFIADKIFLNQFDQVVPNVIGVLFIQLCASAILSFFLVFFVFPQSSVLLKLLMTTNFIVLNLIWLSTVLLTGFKSYRYLMLGFVIGYGVMIGLHFVIKNHSLPLLLVELLVAQVLLFIFIFASVLYAYPNRKLIRFEFLKKGNVHYFLMLTNLFYTVGIWVDKYLFWFNANTGATIFPPLRLSPVYDLPMFLGYLGIVPAAAAFMLQMEAKFSLLYPEYMKTIFRRGSLSEINTIKAELVLAGREAMVTLLKTQASITIILFLAAQFLLEYFNLNQLYLNLLLVVIVAVGLNVMLWGALNILYYITQYFQAFWVSVTFLVTNVVFTGISLQMGPFYYGYGFALSLLVSNVLALFFINKDFKDLNYTTFMMVD